MLRNCLVLAALLLASGCATDNLVGTGDLRVTPSVQRYIDDYMNETEDRVMALAISVDGAYSGYTYCPKDQDCRYEKAVDYHAISVCQSASNGAVPCKLYARGKRVVWQGQVKEGLVMAAAPVVNSEKVGRMALTVDWDGIGQDFRGQAAGRLSIAGLMQIWVGDKSCTGRFGTEGEDSTWSLDCGDLKAQGTYKIATRAYGEGQDQQGRKVRIEIIPPAE